MTNNQRILMLSIHGYVSREPELGKPDTGGQVTFVLELAKRFSRLGYSVDLVTRQFEEQESTEIINSNLRILRIPFGGKKFIRKEDMHDFLGDFITNFLSFCRANNLTYDIVNSHYWDAGWAAQRISEEQNISHIYTPHSLGWWKREEMEDGNLEEFETKYRFEERIAKEYRVVHSCDHVIATTHGQKEILVTHYDINERHIHVIPPGMNEQSFYPLPSEKCSDIRKEYKFHDLDILLLGRLAENKGYDLFIKSLPIIKDKVPNVRAILALGGKNSKADEDFISKLKKLAERLGVAEIVEWRSYVEDQDLPNYYRSSAVFVMPSRYEPFGMVAIEAMACGTPSVITRNGALHESLEFGKHALFADPEDAIELATMITLPLKYESLRNELAREGSRIARRKFGWTGIAKQTLELFFGVIQVRRMENNELFS